LGAYTESPCNSGIYLLTLQDNGTRWRFKIDFKAQQNPANLYFGSSERTLQSLRLPSTPASSIGYSSYKEYDKSRKTLRAGGIGEADSVTDALSNRFREVEVMLNLKVDYALGKGRWRVMGGYEIRHLSYKTFEGLEAEAIELNTGNDIKAPNGTSLLRRDYTQGLISGLDGGWVSIIQAALIYDTRDFEPDPTRGYYLEIANEYSSKYILGQSLISISCLYKVGFIRKYILGKELFSLSQ